MYYNDIPDAALDRYYAKDSPYDTPYDDPYPYPEEKVRYHVEYDAADDSEFFEETVWSLEEAYEMYDRLEEEGYKNIIIEEVKNGKSRII